jgi:hypothetical protein
VQVSIVFRQQRLQYNPPLEELRVRHYRELLGGFLGLPARMRGVSDLSERPGFFRAIADCCPGVARLYASAEALFARLQEELKGYQVPLPAPLRLPPCACPLRLPPCACPAAPASCAETCPPYAREGRKGGPASLAGCVWCCGCEVLLPPAHNGQLPPRRLQDWVVLGGVDLDEFADANLVEVADWELNLRMIKGAARDLDRLPAEVGLEPGGEGGERRGRGSRRPAEGAVISCKRPHAHA